MDRLIGEQSNYGTSGKRREEVKKEHDSVDRMNENSLTTIDLPQSSGKMVSCIMKSACAV